MNEEQISPWVDQAERKSPDNTMTALFENGMEIAMGAPTRGTLSVILPDGGKRIEGTGGQVFCFGISNGVRG
jgi:hypothetical protein